MVEVSAVKCPLYIARIIHAEPVCVTVLCESQVFTCLNVLYAAVRIILPLHGGELRTARYILILYINLCALKSDSIGLCRCVCECIYGILVIHECACCSDEVCLACFHCVCRSIVCIICLGSIGCGCINCTGLCYHVLYFVTSIVTKYEICCIECGHINSNCSLCATLFFCDICSSYCVIEIIG